jgi:hypothetical protein
MINSWFTATVKAESAGAELQMTQEEVLAQVRLFANILYHC